jgi:hypothetical protein
MAPKRRSFQNNQPSTTTIRADEFTQAMVDFLAGGEKRSFNDIFMGVQDTAKRLYPSKGNELMRLQAYELLSTACARGRVSREGREYFRTDIPAAHVVEEGGEA